jgi:hypothetical protein
MPINTYLCKSAPSIGSPLERFADACNFLARHTLMGKRMMINSKSQLEDKTNLIFSMYCVMGKGMVEGVYLAPIGLLAIALVHFTLVPFALIGMCIGMPIKKKCVKENEKSKAYHEALKMLYEQKKIEKNFEKKHEEFIESKFCLSGIQTFRKKNGDEAIPALLGKFYVKELEECLKQIEKEKTRLESIQNENYKEIIDINKDTNEPVYKQHDQQDINKDIEFLINLKQKVKELLEIPKKKKEEAEKKTQEAFESFKKML